MAAIINHATVRGYKLGCRCEECTAANREAKRRERERRRAREGKPPARTPRANSVPTKPKSGPTDDDQGPIEKAARAALKSTDGQHDALTELRREVAFAAARVMDNPKAVPFFKSAADVLRSTVADLVAVSPPKDGEADDLAGILETIGRSRRGGPNRGGKASVDDAAKPSKGNGR